MENCQRLSPKVIGRKRGPRLWKLLRINAAEDVKWNWMVVRRKQFNKNVNRQSESSDKCNHPFYLKLHFFLVESEKDNFPYRVVGVWFIAKNNSNNFETKKQPNQIVEVNKTLSTPSSSSLWTEVSSSPPEKEIEATTWKEKNLELFSESRSITS